MSFLAPAALGLAILLPVIVAMYLLKLRRTELEVSSTYLWRRMVRDVQANAPWQRLQANLLLILQLLFLLALILALARPFSWAEGAGGQATILILDTSASMGATDVSPNRLAAAQEQARQIVDGLPDSARVTVIAAGQEARVLAASTLDRRQAHLAIQSVQLETGGSQLGTALELASALAARQPDAEIVVLSDGRVELPEHLAVKARVRYLPLGLSGENQAISLFSLEYAPGGSSLTAFAQVSNYGEQPAKRRLGLYADGSLVNAYDLDLAPGQQQPVLAGDLPEGTQLVEARLLPPEETGAQGSFQDVLPADDQARAVHPPAEPVQVDLVSSGNLFLETALSLLPGTEVLVTDSEAAEFPPADLTIFDNTLPVTQTLPAGNLLFIAPIRSTEFFSVTGKVESPVLRPVDPNDPLLENVSLGDVSLLDAARIPLPLWARPVIAGDLPDGSTPLLFAGQVVGRRVAVLAFDLRRSDLPLQPAFPILFANLTGWLAPSAGSQVPAQVSPGDSVAFPVPPEVRQVSARRPDGSTLRLQPQNGQVVFADTNQLGLYQLSWGTEQDGGASSAQFVVNLFSPQESQLKPADDLPGALASQTASGEQARQSRHEWWRPLALAALILLTLEWAVYHRPALARLRGELGQYLPDRLQRKAPRL